jgi:hypothetical protein
MFRLLNPTLRSQDRYQLLLDGRLYLPGLDMILTGMNPRQFCIEEFVNGGDFRLGALVCNVDGLDNVPEVGGGERGPCDELKFRLYPAVMSVSCLSLVVTIAVYSLLPELRNLPGKNLICLSGSLLMAFGCLIGVCYRLYFRIKKAFSKCSGIKVTLDTRGGGGTLHRKIGEPLLHGRMKH